MTRDRVAILVTSYPGQPTVEDLARESAAGLRPRSAYVELARALDADVIDHHYMATRAAPVARAVVAIAGLPAGQVCEAFLRRRRYRTVLAWADRLGLPLAFLNKLARSKQDLILYSVWLSRGKKAIFLRRAGVHTHLRAIVNYGSVQMDFAADQLQVPPHKLYHLLHPVDERFWQPLKVPTENFICSVGWEARDYPTLLEAVRGTDLEVRIALGIAGLEPRAKGSEADAGYGRQYTGEELAQFQPLKGTYSYGLHQSWVQGLREAPSENVKLYRQLDGRGLRDLYARARVVVVPLEDVDADCGVTTITEAMAMGKAVIVTRTRGQVDVLRDGEQGMYVPAHDPAALRAAIEHLVGHPEEAERMGRAGRAAVEERHTLDAHVARLVALVSEVADRPAVPLRTSTGKRHRLDTAS